MTKIGEGRYRPIASSVATSAVSSWGADLKKKETSFTYAGQLIKMKVTPEVMVDLKPLTVGWSPFIPEGKLSNGTLAEAVVRLGFSTKKLFDFLVMLLTSSNNVSGDKDNPDVVFILQDLMDNMQYADTPAMRKLCLDLFCEDVSKLGMLTISSSDCSAIWFGVVDSVKFQFVDKDDMDGKRKITKEDVLGDRAYIIVRIKQDLMVHFSKEGEKIIPFLAETLNRLGRNENAYAMTRRMILHCCMACNIGSPSQFILKVRTLWECCPSCSAKKQGDQRRTFEDALNALSNPRDGGEPLVLWRYLNRKGEPFENNKPKRLSELDWADLRVEFEPVGLFRGPDLSDECWASPSDVLFRRVNAVMAAERKRNERAQQKLKEKEEK